MRLIAGSVSVAAVLAVAFGTVAEGTAVPPKRAPSRVQAEATPPTRFPASYERLIAAAAPEGARVGYLVVDPARSETLAARLEDEVFLPGSVAKIATAVAALEVLGAGQRFTTRLLADRDAYYLVGGGDPLLEIGGLATLAGIAAEARPARGKLHYDDGLLVRTAEIADDQSMAATYNPGLSALSFSFNRRKLIWRRTGNGTLKAHALPGGDLAPLVGTPSGKPPFRFLETPVGPTWGLPTLASGERWVPVRRPGRFTATLLRDLIAMRGVEIALAGRRTAPAGAVELGKVDSRPLVRLVSLALQHSNNGLAELIGLGAARELAGTAEPLADGVARLQGFLHGRIAGAGPDTDRSGWRLDRHSGLSADARASPRQITTLLTFADGRRYGGRSFESLLPTAGWHGSLNRWSRYPQLAFRVWAKTGTMHYGRGLAGFLHTQGGRRVAFALFIHDPEARRRIAEFGREPDRAARRGAADWLGRARDLERRLITRWLLTL